MLHFNGFIRVLGHQKHKPKEKLANFLKNC